MVPRLLVGICISSFIFGAHTAPAFAQETQQSFSDVPRTHLAYEAVEYLKARGIIQGYADGTFKPDQNVNRAEAAKIIVAPRMTEEALAQFRTTVFEDIPADRWYLPYVEAARQIFGFVDGPPKKTAFRGESPVLKAEFLKMLLGAYSIDPNSFSEIRSPLAPDVTNTDEWYYPYIRYALTASMTMAGEDGLLHPGKELTRGEVALLLHRFLMYRENRRTQALLSESENEILILLGALGSNNITQAEYAAARALLAARGAHASRPDTPIVRGALKVTEAFSALVQGYRAGLHRDYDSVIAHAKSAWGLAEQAVAVSPELQGIAEQVKLSANSMAENARTLNGQ